MEAMMSFKHLMSAMEIQSYKAYATSAMRDAVNRKEVVDYIEQTSGVKIEIISGEKEASVISGASLPRFIKVEGKVLYMDVGGGSTEFTILDKKEYIQESFNIGTIRALFHNVHSKEWKRLKKWFKDHDLLGSKIPILGSGGNINKIFKIKRKSNIEFHITTKHLKDFYDEIKDLSYQERIIKYQLNPDRADVVKPACEIFLRVIDMLSSEKIFVPKLGLSDGIVRDLYRDYLEEDGNVNYP